MSKYKSLTEETAAFLYVCSLQERSKTVDGFLSPEGGPDITDHELDILAKTYASCRKNGNDKERCSKIAWSAVNKYRKGSE